MQMLDAQHFNGILAGLLGRNGEERDTTNGLLNIMGFHIR